MIRHKRLPAGIYENIKGAKKVLLKDTNVIFAYLFGGLVRGAAPLSDVDIAVYLKDEIDAPEFRLGLFDELTDSLKTDELDLVVLNTAPLSLAGRILMNKKVLVDKEPFTRHLYESLTLRKFLDFKVKEESFLKRRYSIG